MPTFCWPSAVDSARHAGDVVDFARTGRLQARQSSEPDVLAAVRKDAIVNDMVSKEKDFPQLQ
jgi:hypothetical protein